MNLQNKKKESDRFHPDQMVWIKKYIFRAEFLIYYSICLTYIKCISRFV